MTSRRRTVPSPSQGFLFPSPIGPQSANSALEGAAPESAARDYRDTFNGRLLKDLTLMTPHDIPRINPSTLVPDRLIPFSETKRRRHGQPKTCVHFYEDDYRAEKFWRSPEKHIDRLHGFAGVISPDFSLYSNMPRAQKVYNTYRNQLLGAWLQQTIGINVIPNVRLSGPESVPYALAGVPQNSTLAIGLHGCTKNRMNRREVMEEIRLICDHCQPTSLVVYGSTMYGVLDDAHAIDIPVYAFAPDHRHRSLDREAA